MCCGSTGLRVRHVAHLAVLFGRRRGRRRSYLRLRLVSRSRTLDKRQPSRRDSFPRLGHAPGLRSCRRRQGRPVSLLDDAAVKLDGSAPLFLDGHRLAAIRRRRFSKQRFRSSTRRFRLRDRARAGGGTKAGLVRGRQAREEAEQCRRFPRRRPISSSPRVNREGRSSATSGSARAASRGRGRQASRRGPPPGSSPTCPSSTCWRRCLTTSLPLTPPEWSNGGIRPRSRASKAIRAYSPINN